MDETRIDMEYSSKEIEGKSGSVTDRGEIRKHPSMVDVANRRCAQNRLRMMNYLMEICLNNFHNSRTNLVYSPMGINSALYHKTYHLGQYQKRPSEY